ncbi:hypothetical protein KAU04_03780, partial [bacterium]|nr:hypothetical protein [bacterium]
MKTEKTVRFYKPIPLPSDRDAVEYRFPFAVIDSSLIGKPEEESETSHHSIKVTITGTLAACWGFGRTESDPVLEKVLFEYGKRHIVEKLHDGILSDKEELLLATGNQPNECPFDPSRISEPSGTSIKVPIHTKGLMQYPEQNQRAEILIERRDYINAIFKERHGSKLLLINEERPLLHFFREANSEDEFTSRVIALANIVGNLNIDILRKITGISDTQVKSISLLDAYLKPIGGNYETIISIFRNLNRIRQGYPVHQDNA